MTIEEANNLLGVAKVNYSYAFRSMSDDDKRTLVKSWAFIMQDIPGDIVMLAFMQLLAVCKWLPTPAEIREQVKKLYYEASRGLLCGSLDMHSDMTMEYIVRNTYHLRGEKGAELGLDEIVKRGYGKMLGTSDSAKLSDGRVMRNA